jgi:hypothetical protein
MYGWNLQEINAGRLTTGPKMSIPMSNLCVSVFNGQQHVAYFDSAGALWDSWYDPAPGSWKLQKINNGGCTTAPLGLASSTPSVWVVWDQQHFTYRDASGNIWDPFYDGPSGSWRLQQINAGGCTKGPPATSDPFGCTYLNGQQHVGYFAGGDFWDPFYNPDSNSWDLQRINNGGCTKGPAALAVSYDRGPFVWTVFDQQHFTYPDAEGAIWDAFYEHGNNSWNLQQINLGGCTTGPRTVGFPFVSVYWNGQQHVLYRGADGSIWDSWYDNGNNEWKLQKVNLGGCTNGPAAVSDPSVGVYGAATVLFGTETILPGQFHVAYRDASSDIWDSWYDGPPGPGTWKLQKINTGGCTTGPAALQTPFIWTWGQQQHFTYPDSSGAIWDSWWDGYVPPLTVDVKQNTIVLNYNLQLGGPDSGSITGWANLTLDPDGSYNYSGSIHNSNLGDYNCGILFVTGCKDVQTLFTFEYDHSVPGSLGDPFGSHTVTWDNTGNNATIKNLWNDLVQGFLYWYSAKANFDLNSTWNEVKTEIGYASDVVTVVGSL